MGKRVYIVPVISYIDLYFLICVKETNGVNFWDEFE